MVYLKRFLANAKANPKTTATGIAGIVGCITGAAHNPGKLASAEWWTLLLVSGGLLIAADQGASKPTA